MEKILQILDYLEVEELREEIENLLILQIAEYDVFVLFNFAYRMSLNRVI